MRIFAVLDMTNIAAKMTKKEDKLDDLYSICPMDRVEEGYRYQITLNPGHSVFQGHFPGNPVLPGVCMMRIIKDCASRTTGRKLRYHTIRSCKFLSVINPVETPSFLLTFSLNDPFVLQATATTGDTAVLKLKAELKQE